MKLMYTFRFNPVFKQWVLLGEVIPTNVAVLPVHGLDKGKKIHPDFSAAHFPRSPFLLDPPKGHKKHEDDLLFAAEAPVGEYEVMIYNGEQDFYKWPTKTWEQWLLLLNERIRAMHHNPHLHFINLKLHTRSLHTTGELQQRVGDLIATSHPIAGMSTPLASELVHKLLDKEKLFAVYHDAAGTLYTPSAPLNDKELWYFPKEAGGSIEMLGAHERKNLAHSLSLAFAVLKEEFPTSNFLMTIHTAMAGAATDETTWWIQIHAEETGFNNPLSMRPLPERFTFLMKQLLAHHSSERHD